WRPSPSSGALGRCQDQTLSARNSHILVIEAWHLPSAPEEGDGRHVLTISDAVLMEEEWTRDDFPLAVMRYNPKENGYFAQGLCEIVAPLQTEMNTLLRKI